MPSDSGKNPILLWVVAIAFFMQSLDMTILNTALPAMARSLGTSPLHMQPVLISYMLTVALLIPASGWVADRYGTRTTLASAMILFTLGSLCCAEAQTLTQLVLARVLQGVGGAWMLPVGRLVLLRTWPRRDLVQAMSFVTMPGLVGPLLGPTLGGWLVELASWHWIFLINLPVGILGWLAIQRHVPELRRPDGGRFDWVGFILFGNAMVLVSFALEGLGHLKLGTQVCAMLAAIGLVSLIGYWLHAGRTTRPLFSLQLLETRSFSVGILGNLVARLGGGCMPFLTPLLLQIVLGYSPTQAGLAMIPSAAAALCVKPVVKPLVDWLGFRRLLVLNTVLLGAILGSFQLIDLHTPLPVLLAMLTLFGAINSLQFTFMNTVTLYELPDQHAAAGNSMLSVVMQLSRSLGVAVAGALLAAFVGTSGSLPGISLLPAFHTTYLCIGLITLVGAAIFIRLPAHGAVQASAT
ncbi:drug resistance transporter, EmrB/QacA subfamily [Andreprevotia lacus DSM 23236]|uniref:Drug resistance transporter, EmrB/QacA subfamily n=1 Tax=Andreprevotia lacus DSM 23236 TaxID=1121001 RepID=A0A1W1XF74_9NEIS|nr:multidrug transporter subunit MdtD [Andreprevotia lacus]SMC22579.1 drug resistance transporter, EmrB/QacA subfamily [Andreprevotia lacus DSM 23236]